MVGQGQRRVFERLGGQCREGPPLGYGARSWCVMRARREEMWVKWEGLRGVGGRGWTKVGGSDVSTGVEGCRVIQRLLYWPLFSPGAPSLMGETDLERILVTITKFIYGVELVYAKCLDQCQCIVHAT